MLETAFIWMLMDMPKPKPLEAAADALRCLTVLLGTLSMR